ncbi:MAG: 16S rRNA (adenine(1518)-N(6)/adenine(1519)-N(6))-dimethyltransferase RsmA [Xanthomonadales bacterium]|nr:16S rRNA (adenine(1518)-N(6)/adenine(1519)-N(6))-dimethyltransferase RsmA [Xanthomonadales bacterium]
MAAPIEHRARKRFGQNFLHDPGVIRRILGAIDPKPDDHLVEIGPGLGALTEPLLQTGARLTAVEIDRDLAADLRRRFGDVDRFTLIEGDALKLDLGALDGPLRVVGNLPYNISTPLVFHLLAHAVAVRDIHIMLQKEVVERMAAAPGGGDYGRLSVMAQYHARIEPLFTVGPGAFRPAPSVQSAVVRLEPRGERPLDAAGEVRLTDAVRTAFTKRRKTLHNALKGQATDAQMASAGIDPTARAETVPVANWVALAATMGD